MSCCKPRVLSYIDFENDALARVLDGCDVLKHVFYRMLASKMVLWLEFWKRRCALARVLDGPVIENVVICSVLKHRAGEGAAEAAEQLM